MSLFLKKKRIGNNNRLIVKSMIRKIIQVIKVIRKREALAGKTDKNLYQ